MVIRFKTGLPQNGAGTARLSSRSLALFVGGIGLFAGAIGVPAQAASPQAPDSPSAVAEVRVANFTFTPPLLTVTAGTTVTWVNADDIPHVVVANDHSFRSKPLDTDDQFSFTFATPGEYAYFCALHPHMVGKIVVTPLHSQP
ncbi:cupredoxin domain-containing protein [Microvirga sp. 2TAF3]|uniref:cupredoxin domain-containing protein n=1 Tax=Microvirga sp. 2TAF3 TaxID=3233014 RepID=UPI003F99A225